MMCEEDPLLNHRNSQDNFYRTSSDRSNYARRFVTSYYRLVSNPQQLETAERRVLSGVVSNYTQEQVRIGAHTTINTLHFQCNCEERRDLPPLVMIHGFGVGLGMFVKNFDDISKHTDVYAIDLLGFGRSSRPNFSRRPEEIIQQYIQSLEDWRAAVGLDKFILLGHSFGGYLSTWYALKHPGRIAKLILVEPWGYPRESVRTEDVDEDENNAEEVGNGNNAEEVGNGNKTEEVGNGNNTEEVGGNGNNTRPRWLTQRNTFRYKVFRFVFGIIRNYLKLFLPFSFVRFGFGIAKPLFKRFRSDLVNSYEYMVDADTLSDYFFHLNGQYPSGEEAFTRLHIPFGWCREPLLPDRIRRMDVSIQLDFIYGQESWMTSKPVKSVTDLIGNEVKLYMVPHSSHHVYANNSVHFNNVVIESINSLLLTQDEHIL